jgi:hypothetical protein
MTTHAQTPTKVSSPGQRLLASLRSNADDRPHPAMLMLARQPRAAARRNRHLAEFLRIERGRLA